MNVFSQFLLYQKFDIPGSIENIENNLSEDTGVGFTIKGVENHQYKCVSNFSLGTMVVRGTKSQPDGIKLYMSLESLNSFRTSIILRSKLRPELALMAGVLLLFAILIIVKPSFNLTNKDILLSPIGLIWLWLAYRVQEYLLMQKIKKYLNEVVRS